MSAPLKSAQARKLGAIRVARKQLGLEDDTYRAMLREITGGKTSSKDLTPREVDKVLDHLIAKGFRLAPPKARSAGEPSRRMDTSSEASKARALWLLLHELGEVRDPSERALASYVRRIAKVDDLHWADAAAMNRLIETLKKWAMRRLPGRCEDLNQRMLASGLKTVLAAQLAYATARERGTFDPYNAAYQALKRYAP